MNIHELEMSDFALVEVKSINDCAPTPHCKKHGAMNKITKDENGGGTWRCISVVGIRNTVTSYGAKAKIEVDGICRAGCYQVGPACV